MITDRQAAEFEKRLALVLRKFQFNVIAALKEATKTGDIAFKLTKTAQMLPSLYEALKDSGFDDLAAELVNSDIEIIKDFRNIHAATGIDAAFTTVSRDMLTALQQTELSFFNGLSNKMISDVHGVLMETVLTGLPDNQIIKRLNEIVDAKHARYIQTYAQTSRTQYLQTLEDLSARERAKETGVPPLWIYEGPADNKNRDECVWALDKYYFTDAERSEFEEAYGLRWNCRHIFVEVMPEDWHGEHPDQLLDENETARRDKIIESFNKPDPDGSKER